MFEIVFINRESGRTNYAITDVRVIRYVTPSEVGFTTINGDLRGCPFPASEKLEINRKETP